MRKEKGFIGLVLILACYLGIVMSMEVKASGLVVTKTEDGGTQTVSAVNNVYILEKDGKYTISGATNSETIKVTGTNIEVTLDSVDINVLVEDEVNGKTAFSLDAGASAKIIVKGENFLKSGNKKAGLHVPTATSIEISSDETNGKLHVTGGYEGAGIGGGSYEGAGTIEITGGTVFSRSTALVDKNTGAEIKNTGAGIGGGLSAGGGSITISGGTVYATGAKGGAGIGTGAYGGTCGDVTITGGNIVVVGGYEGAGIGGGLSSKGGNVTINGGTIVSIGGSQGAGIGGGKSTSNEGRAGTLKITGGSVNRSGTTEKEAKATTDGVTEVYLVEFQLSGISTPTAVTAGKVNNIPCTYAPNPEAGVYGLKDVMTDENGKLYLWLQKQTNTPVDLTADKKQYEFGAFTQELTISTKSLTDTTVGSAYKGAISAGPGKPRYVIETGSLPSGLKLDKLTGKITGTTTKAGEYSFTVKAYVGSAEEKKTFMIRVAAKKGTIFTVGNYTYQITNAKTDGNGTVTLTGLAKNKKVTTVTAAKTVSYKGFNYKVTAVGAKAFYKNKDITAVSIGNNVKVINKSAFSECKKLTKVSLGNSVTTLKSLVFYKCPKLKTVVIGTGLKTIGNHTFCHNTAMQVLTIKSKQLKAVGTHNFYQCNNLKIKVPSAKVNAYTKLFKGQGQKKNVKVMK